MRNEDILDFVPEFPGQREDEQVLLVLYKHWFTIFYAIAKSLLVILLSFAVPLWLGFTDFIFSFPVTAFLYYAWLVYWVGAILYDYINWFKDRYIITTQRVIEINQKGFFKRRVSEIELDKIHHITHAVLGVFATIFNYGSVSIQSAGNHDVNLDHVASPADIQEDIARLVKDVVKNNQIDPHLVDLIKSDNAL